MPWINMLNVCLDCMILQKILTMKTKIHWVNPLRAGGNYRKAFSSLYCQTKQCTSPY